MIDCNFNYAFKSEKKCISTNDKTRTTKSFFHKSPFNNKAMQKALHWTKYKENTTHTHFFGQSSYNAVVCGFMLTRNSLNLASITATVSTTKKYFLRIISQSKSFEFQSTVSLGEYQEACHSPVLQI